MSSLGISLLSNKRSSFSPKDLHVVIPYSNHLRYLSRHRLIEESVQHMLLSGVTLYVVELAFGDRPHVLDLPSQVHHIKLRSKDEMWHKENQINIGLNHAIDNGAKYLSWMDGDIHFANLHWASEAIEALQTYAVIQPWTQSVDLDQHNHIIPDENKHITNQSFLSLWLEQLSQGMGYDMRRSKTDKVDEYGAQFYKSGVRRFGHSGYAWASTTEAYHGFGGMLDGIVTGSADYMMAQAFVGFLGIMVENNWVRGAEQPGYKRRLLDFQARCDQNIKKNVGALPGMIYHGWHGPKVKRGYLTRPQILTDSKFDPDLDLKMMPNGLYAFARDNYPLRDGLRAYFRSRDEDAPNV